MQKESEHGVIDAIGSALLVASGAAAFACIPASIRAESITAWIAMTGTVLVPVALSGFLFARAWPTVRAIRSDPVFGIALWAAAWAGSVAAIGAVLRQKTHHHALAGVTFGLLAVALGLVWALIVRRVVTLRDKWSEDGERGRVIWLTVASIGLAAVLVARAARGALDLAPIERASVVDGLALLLATVLVAQRFDRPLRRPVAFVGLPLAAVVIVAGLYLSHTPAGDQIALHAPLISLLVVR